MRDNGGHAVALKWTMRNIYDTARAKSIGRLPTSVGLSGTLTSFMRRFSTVTRRYYTKENRWARRMPALLVGLSPNTVVSNMFTAPTAIRAIKKEDPQGKMLRQYDLSKLRALFLAGERCDPDTILWAEKSLQTMAVDHWWQTETGWTIAGNPLGIEKFPIKAGSSTKAMAGYNLQVLDEAGEQKKAGELGNLVIKLPLPPGTLPKIWGDEERYREGYLSHYPGYYLSGDSGMIDDDGYVHIMSRIDDVINVAAHRLSTGAMEETLCRHPDVAEAAVFGVRDDLKGELPLGLAVLNSECQRPPEEIANELIGRVREEIGPVADFKLISQVKRLPKTRSGKILRATMRKIANGETYDIPPTIDDPAILAEIAETLKTLGYPTVIS